MKLQGDQASLYLSGQDVPIPECNIVVHQPTIKQIVMFKESHFLAGVGILAHAKENANRVRENNSSAYQFSDFQILLAVITQDSDINSSVDSLFQLIFPQYKVVITNEEIYFYDGERRAGMVHERNYDAFINTIDKLFTLPSDRKKEYNPANEKARKIAEKFKARDEILAKKKGREDGSPSLFGTYVSVLSIGMHLDMNIL